MYSLCNGRIVFVYIVLVSIRKVIVIYYLKTEGKEERVTGSP